MTNDAPGGALTGSGLGALTPGHTARIIECMTTTGLLGAIVVPALLAAGCGGNGSEPGAGSTTVAEPPVTEAAEPDPEAADLDTEVFRMPSGNIGCAVGGGVLRCDILSGLQPEPTETCELDWVGVTIPTEGSSEPNCAGDTAFDPSAPVLEYGKTWRRAGFECESSESGLRCTNESSNTFSLSREAWETS